KSRAASWYFVTVYRGFFSISTVICFCVGEWCSIWIVERLFIFLDWGISRLVLCFKYCETTRSYIIYSKNYEEYAGKVGNILGRKTWIWIVIYFIMLSLYTICLNRCSGWIVAFENEDLYASCLIRKSSYDIFYCLCRIQHS